jgi:hypothetical protein
LLNEVEDGDGILGASNSGEDLVGLGLGPSSKEIEELPKLLVLILEAIVSSLQR